MPALTVAAVSQRPKAVRFADGRRVPTPLERHTMNLTGEEEEASIIDTNMLLDRLREAAAAAEVTLAEEAAAEERAAREAEENLKRRAFLGANTGTSETPHLDAIAAAAQRSEMQARFSELDRKLRSASEAVEQVAMVYATAVRDGVFNKMSTVPYNNGSNIRLPRFWAGEEERLTAVRKELTSSGRLSIKSTQAESPSPGLTGEDEKGIISEFVSEVTGRRARTAAARGQLRVLQTIQAERSEWAAYLTLPSWDLQCPLGDTALILACQEGHLTCVESLLAWGADPNLANSQGATPLHAAGSRAIAELLIRHGADPTKLDKLGRTPYMVAKSCHLGSHGHPRAEVVHAFGPAQQLTSNKAGKVVAPTEENIRAMEAERARALANTLYHQGLGALALGQFDAAVLSFRESLAADSAAPCSTAAREHLAAAERQMAVLNQSPSADERPTGLARPSSL